MPKKNGNIVYVRGCLRATQATARASDD